MSAKIALTALGTAGEVVPGADTVLKVQVTNRSDIVDRLQFQVLGVIAASARVDPPELNLLPGESAQVATWLTIPLDTSAGPYPFALHAFSADNPAEATDLNFEVTVT